MQLKRLKNNERNNCTWSVEGRNDSLFYAWCEVSDTYGVRPVIEYSKDYFESNFYEVPMQQIYDLGTELTIGGENFYVISHDNKDRSTVTLISKYNLNTAGTAQVNADKSQTACVFSSDNYWSTTWQYYVDWPFEKFNLNHESGYSTSDGMDKVKKYAESKGGKGRMLTYEEESSLRTEIPDIIFGKYNGTQKYLNYWVSSAYEERDNCVYNVVGQNDSIFYAYHGVSDEYGIRPVIEMEKSK